MTTIPAGAYVGVAGRNEYFFTPTDVPNYVNGLDGNDAAIGWGQVDTLYGGLGRDLIYGDAANDSIFGDQFWNDETTNVNPLLAAEADLIRGGNGADTIFAGGGNNYVNGGADNDYVMGGSGNELLQGGSGNDSVYGAAGNDTLVGGTRSASDNAAFLTSNIGDFTTDYDGLNDSAFNFSITVSSYAASELTLTSTGNDYLDGGLGDDRLYGGDGTRHHDRRPGE